MTASPPLSASRRATLRAVVARIVPAASSGFADVLEARISRVPAPLAGELGTALDVFGGRLAALLTVGRPGRFAALPPEMQDRMLARWEGSRLPVQRTVFQALRRLTLATYYATPEAQASIGYLGPLHTRAPVYAWEGPFAGAPEDGAVAGISGQPGESLSTDSGGSGVATDGGTSVLSVSAALSAPAVTSVLSVSATSGALARGAPPDGNLLPNESIAGTGSPPDGANECAVSETEGGGAGDERPAGHAEALLAGVTPAAATPAGTTPAGATPAGATLPIAMLSGAAPVDAADSVDVRAGAARAAAPLPAPGAPPRLHHRAADDDAPHHRVAASTIRLHPVADGDALVADAIVIGSGAGGSVAAARLAESGLDVLVLEAGGLYDAARLTEEDGPMAEALYADQGLRASRDLSLGMLQGACVGGGTTVNWMIMLRPHDGVLDEWAQRFGTEGMRAADLAPVFAQVEDEVHARPVPEGAHSPNNRILLDGAASLGWRARGGIINARGCIRSGFCGHGCRYGAKQGALATYLPRALAAGARLVADARADRIEIVERGGDRPRKRVAITLRDPVTRAVRGRASASAPIVVLAGGAVETPALLQRSGLGGGGVGRYLRVHPTTAVVGLYDRPIYAAAGMPLTAVCDEFSRSDVNGYGFWIECPPLHPSLAAAGAGGFGTDHAALMRQFPNMGALIALVRDGADLDASNGSVAVDRRGNARVRYRLGAKDAAHLRRAIAAAARLHLAAGAREALTLHARPVRVRTEADLAAAHDASVAPNDVTLLTAHVNGTCRLGVSPRTSGTRPDGQRHGAPGVYVCDGSLLPTALGVNPQATIMALATVVAARVTARA